MTPRTPTVRAPAAYRTIVADPPWEYAQSRILTTAKRVETRPEALTRYGAMTTSELAGLPIKEQVADDAHLYLWVTNPILYGGRGRGRHDAPAVTPIDILEAWGFEYVTLLTWHKLGTLGLGYYFRGDTEHVLFGVRGKAPIAPSARERNWFAAPKVGHSVKPDRFYELVERVSPGPYLELFARRRRYGWDVWGDQAPEFAASQAEMGLPA